MAEGYHRKLGGELGDPLSPTEEEVLQLRALGYMIHDVAIAFRRSHWTINTHQKRLIRKLGARNITNAVYIYYGKGKR